LTFQESPAPSPFDFSGEPSSQSLHIYLTFSLAFYHYHAGCATAKKLPLIGCHISHKSKCKGEMKTRKSKKIHLVKLTTSEWWSHIMGGRNRNIAISLVVVWKQFTVTHLTTSPLITTIVNNCAKQRTCRNDPLLMIYTMSYCSASVRQGKYRILRIGFCMIQCIYEVGWSSNTQAVSAPSWFSDRYCVFIYDMVQLCFENDHTSSS
jgi:hypothetical protein